MTDKLISMVDFVLELNTTIPENVDTRHHYINIVNYAKFLKQPLTLGMFVPVSEAGEVLEEPELYKEYNPELGGTMNEDWRARCEAYNKAKSRYLFEGFTYKGRELFLYGKLIWFGELKGTVEEIVQMDLTLTPYAKELIYGN